MGRKSFQVGPAQRVAAGLLLILLLECFWTIYHQPLDSDDYRYAQCGREMWERPSPLQGYFTTCGNLNGDGTLAYRVAGLPLTLQRVVLLAGDELRRPADRLYNGGSLNGTTWEARHELSYIKWLIRSPFVLFALCLAGGLWWVARRLYGNEGGALALALFVFDPAIVHYAAVPNNEILALSGLYGLVYTAIGVAHALQGPKRKWRPRILLLTLALGFTAAAHLLAAAIGVLAGTVFLYYLAERRRSYVAQIMIYSALGAFFILLASFSFRLQAFTYVFTGGAARFWFSLTDVRHFLLRPANAPTLVAAGVALVVYLTTRRSRYFGNTVPLVMVLLLFALYTTQVITAPWLWALPFLFTFIGGVFADVLETRQRRTFLLLSGSTVVAQAALCWTAMASSVTR